MIGFKRALVACTAFVVIILLSTAFVSFDIEMINPINWSVAGRLFLVVFTAIIALLASGYSPDR